jgi:hypothetical protein
MNKKTMKKGIIVAGTLAMLTVFLPLQASALDLGDILKRMGKTYAAGIVTKNVLAEPADKFLNGILMQGGLATSLATKVVPIVAVGQGTRTGMAQVTGPAEAVADVMAVFEGEFSSGRNIRGRILIPINTANPFGGMKRVDGVGVSAVFDYRL